MMYLLNVRATIALIDRFGVVTRTVWYRFWPSVRSGSDAQLLAGPVIEHHDLAADLGPFVDSRRPRHGEGFAGAADCVGPLASCAVEVDHGCRAGFRVTEGAGDEQVVVGVVAVHVREHRGD